MKQRKETRIYNAFTVETIVTIYHLKMKEQLGCREYSMEEKVEAIYDFWQLVYLESGHYICNIDGNTLELTAGQMLFGEPGKARYTLLAKEAVVAIISFRCDSEKMQLLKNRVLMLPAEDREVLARLLTIGVRRFRVISDERAYFGQEPECGTADYELQAIKNHLELLLIALYEKRDNVVKNIPAKRNLTNYYAAQFEQIEEFMQCSLYRNISVKEISEKTGFSISSVKRICTNCVGCGAIHYFITLKVEESKRLIRESDMNISQISERLGFSGIHYFSRIFKNRTGLTPSQYAKSVLKE